MKLQQLKFKKLGNHWYLDLPHDNPNDLILHPVLERCVGLFDKYQEEVVDRIYLSECVYTNYDYLIQFTDKDLLKYFTTSEEFLMDVYINNHKYNISSKLYSLLEAKYGLDFHVIPYRIIIF